MLYVYSKVTKRLLTLIVADVEVCDAIAVLHRGSEAPAAAVDVQIEAPLVETGRGLRGGQLERQLPALGWRGIESETMSTIKTH